MLPAAHRLRRSGDFATTVRRGRRAARGCVVVHLLRPTPAVDPRTILPADSSVTIDTPEIPPSASPLAPGHPAAAAASGHAGSVVSGNLRAAASGNNASDGTPPGEPGRMVASETPVGEPGRSAASGSSTASGALPTEPGFVADSGNNGGSEVLPAEAGHPVVTPAAEPGGRDAVATETRADHTAPGAGEPVDADLRPASAERGGQTGPATGVLRGGLADGSPAESGGVEPARAGFVVSKAVGGAVVRNRVKRRLRHLMAEQIDRLPPGATIVVRAQPSAAQRAYQEMAMDLENALDAALRPGRRQ